MHLFCSIDCSINWVKNFFLQFYVLFKTHSIVKSIYFHNFATLSIKNIFPRKLNFSLIKWQRKMLSTQWLFQTAIKRIYKWKRNKESGLIITVNNLIKRVYTTSILSAWFYMLKGTVNFYIYMFLILFVNKCIQIFSAFYSADQYCNIIVQCNIERVTSFIAVKINWHWYTWWWLILTIYGF